VSLFAELKRRNVFRVAIAYAVVAWLVMQVTDVVLNNVAAPGWVFHVIMLLLGIGFIIVVGFSWAFEMTPEGIKRESEVDRTRSITHLTGKKLDRMITGILVVALGYFVLDKFVLSAGREQAAVEAALEQAGAQPVAEAVTEAAVAEPDRSIAVLPFVNMSDDKQQEFFSDGLSEELLNLLAKIPELQVAARTSAFSFKGKDVTIAEVAEELGVAHVLEGSVRSAGDRIRVTAQLIRADNGFHLWSDTYDRTLDDVFAIQDEIAGHVVEALKVTLLGEPAHSSETTPEAYALYLQALHLSNQLVGENYPKAVALYEKVLEIDPDYAPAWAGLSRNYRNMAVDGQLDELRGFEMALEAARKAVELDPELAEAQARLGMILLDWKNDQLAAARHFRTAMRLNPNDPAALQGVADFYLYLNDVGKSIELGEAAVLRDPVDAVKRLRLGRAYQQAGRLADAIAAFEVAINLSGNVAEGRYALGAALLVSGEPERALEAFEREVDEEYRVKGRALCFHAMGRNEEFEAEFARLREEWGETWPSEIAHVYAWTGDADKAFEWLDRAVAMAEGGIGNSRRIPWLEPLHGDPRWEAYLEKLGISDPQLAQIRAEIGWD